MIKRTNKAKFILPFLYSMMLAILLIYQPYREVLRPIESLPISVLPVEKTADLPVKEKALFQIAIQEDISLRIYFDYIDSLVCQYDSLLPYSLDEHLLVRANDWIIDTLANTDYYTRMEKGQFVYDQRELVILKKGDTLQVPNVETAANLIGKRTMVVIDLNIPEFKLRILDAGKIVHTFPVRVGKNEVKYLDMAKRKVDLRTTPGVGKIIRLNRDPAFINPVNGKRYQQTKRDDGKYTKMPLIPYIEPEINGQRYGELMHPTTNPKTLGKAYSNGCIGLTEADTWRLYYYAPLGTKVVFRYDLEVKNEEGKWIQLKDIYAYRKKVASRILAFF